MEKRTLTDYEQTQRSYYVNEYKTNKQDPELIKQIYQDWTNEQSLIKDDIHLDHCWICMHFTITNHQSTCLKCAYRLHKFNDEWQKKNKNCCSICGKKNKLVLDSNTCKRCLNNCF